MWFLGINGKPYFTFETDEEARDFMDEIGTDQTWELAYVSGS
jgi:hypothetical protein